jgi:hypothetical protein
VTELTNIAAVVTRGVAVVEAARHYDRARRAHVAARAQNPMNVAAVTATRHELDAASDDLLKAVEEFEAT